MFDKEFNDVYNALYELANSMCKEVENNCKQCPFYSGNPRDSYGCIAMKVKYEIYRAENRVGIRELNKIKRDKE